MIRDLSAACSCGSVPCSSASTTVPCTDRWGNICIGFIVWMTLRTMRFGQLLKSAWDSCAASSYVFFMRDWFKMFRIDAGRIPAQVIEGQSMRDFPHNKFVGESVCINNFVAVPETSIAPRRFAADPEPTRGGLFDFRPKPFFDSFGRSCEFTRTGVVTHGYL